MGGAAARLGAVILFVVIVGLHGVRGKYALADASLKMADPNRFRGKDLPVLDQLTDPPGVRRVYHIQAGLPDPFQPPSLPITVYYAVLERACRSVLLNAPSEAPQIVRGASEDVRKQPYNLTIAWFRMGGNCAIPITVMEYTECSYNKSLGACPISVYRCGELELRRPDCSRPTSEGRYRYPPGVYLTYDSDCPLVAIVESAPDGCIGPRSVVVYDRDVFSILYSVLQHLAPRLPDGGHDGPP